MSDFDFYKEIRICQALEELDERLKSMNIAPFELNVIGGFALLLENIRQNKNDYTDVDYIGKDLNNEIKEIIDEIGFKYNFGRGWINNDVLLSGSSLEEMEFVTGPLKFKKKFELSVITVNSLDKEDLLRMKIIALDTSFVALSEGGDFTRLKDFNDVKLLMESLNMSFTDLKKATIDYVLDPDIFCLINYYLQTGKLDMFFDKKYIRIIEIFNKDKRRN